MGKKKQPPAICPVCGEDVPLGSLACPECGADHNSGWKEDAADYDGVSLPEDERFDYEEFLRNEFGSSKKPAGIKSVWWITAVILILVLAGVYFFRAR